jgi:resuscitation-promoting factor RpfA
MYGSTTRKAAYKWNKGSAGVYYCPRNRYLTKYHFALVGARLGAMSRTRRAADSCFLMMRKTTLYARASALPAIAAVLALTSTTALAQEAVPQSQPATSTPPPTVTEPAPTTTDTTTTTTVTTPDEPAATEMAAPAISKSTRTTRVTRTTRATTATARPSTPTRVTRTVTTHSAAQSAAPAAPTPATPVPAPRSQSAVTPIVDTTAKPAPAPQTATAQPRKTDETVPIAAGGALALLALGGTAYALSRRRRHAHEEEWVEERPTAHEPIEETAIAEPRHDPIFHEEQPAMVAPSAFAWGNERPSQSADEDDRMPGETWIQRAYRGPTPNNPSVSLRARLKRAAFFDKRERDVAAGKAEPVDLDAGLPEAMVEEHERELA